MASRVGSCSQSVLIDAITLKNEAEHITSCSLPPIPASHDPFSNSITCPFEQRTAFCGWIVPVKHRCSFKIGGGKVGEFWLSQPISAHQGATVTYVSSNDCDSAVNLKEQHALMSTARPHILGSPRILSFWYHSGAAGEQDFRLQIQRVNESGFEYSDVIWEWAEDSQVLAWRLATVILCSTSPFMVSNHPTLLYPAQVRKAVFLLAFQLTFNVSFSTKNQVIALDDIVLANENVLHSLLTAPESFCPGSSLATLSCSFEDGGCGWANEVANYSWKTVERFYDGSPIIPYEITAPADRNLFVVVSNNNLTGSGLARFISAPIAAAVPTGALLSF